MRRPAPRRSRRSGRRRAGCTTTSPAPSPSSSGSRRRAPSSRSSAARSRRRGVDAAAARVPVDDRLAQRGDAGRLRVGVRIGRGGERVADRAAGVGSTGEPTERSTMPSGCARARSANGHERVPGEVGQRRAPCARSAAPAAAARRRAGGPCGSRRSWPHRRASRARRRTRRWPCSSRPTCSGRSSS